MKHEKASCTISLCVLVKPSSRTPPDHHRLFCTFSLCLLWFSQILWFILKVQKFARVQSSVFNLFSLQKLLLQNQNGYELLIFCNTFILIVHFDSNSKGSFLLKQISASQVHVFGPKHYKKINPLNEVVFFCLLYFLVLLSYF